MKKLIMIMIVTSLVVFICAGSSIAVTFNYYTDPENRVFPELYGDSWDNPSDEVEAVLASLGDVTLTNINGFAGEQETWQGSSAFSVIMEEIAGYETRTTFGWYNADSIGETGMVFSGSDTNGAESGFAFLSELNFGFYIDPNGQSENRMYTEHNLNTGADYQVVIFKIEDGEFADQYILGWEDLDVNGGTGGDRDFQDMIVRVSINPVPEPANMLLLGTGLIGIAGIGRKKIFKN